MIIGDTTLQNSHQLYYWDYYDDLAVELVMDIVNMSYSKRTVTYKWQVYYSTRADGYNAVYQDGLTLYLDLYSAENSLYQYNTKQLISKNNIVYVTENASTLVAEGEVELPYAVSTDGTVFVDMYLKMKGNLYEGDTTHTSYRESTGSNTVITCEMLTDLPFNISQPFVTFTPEEYPELVEEFYGASRGRNLYGFFNTTVGAGTICIPSVEGVERFVMRHETSYGGVIWDYVFEQPTEGVHTYQFGLDTSGAVTLNDAIRREAEESGEAPKYYYFATSVHRVVYTDGSTRASTGEVPYVISSTTPAVTGTVVDTLADTIAITGDSSTMLRNFSDILATISVEAQGGATIVETGISNAGETAINVDSYTFYKTGNNIFDFYATDDRGETGFARVVMPVVEYQVPTAKINMGVITGEGEVNLSVSGRYFAQNIGTVANTIAVYYRYKIQNDDSDFTDWIQLTDVTVAADTNSYVATGYVTGLDYSEAYIFQAYIADYLTEVYSADYIAVSTPIFDWSATDFNFNVPVTVQGVRVASGNKVLWSGHDLMTDSSTIGLSELVSQQPHGIALIFSGVDADTSWNIFYVPKLMVSLYNGGAQTFMMANNAGMDKFAAKYLYINDDSITGQVSNDEISTATSGINYNNAAFELRYVLGV